MKPSSPTTSSCVHSSVNDPCQGQQIDDRSLDVLFRNARSQNGWLDKPIETDTLKDIYNLARMGPTSMNCCPMRIVFVNSIEEKTRLLPAISEGNQEKIRTAPVVAIIAYDFAFADHLEMLFPHRKIRHLFNDNAELESETTIRNGTLQGAYFMMAARAMGLDCGPISGFDRDAVDRIYFTGTRIKSNFLCAMGYGDSTRVFPRLPRFEFDAVCRVL
ncbi:MAG: putative NADH dehydrogenase/NAD(P)H nitroreductase [marine bacterium B5-7]|nr:MAG: putative NADH dehydrogenase/NAD(P)H nitroreductase [marine bacterium B5-7]